IDAHEVGGAGVKRRETAPVRDWLNGFRQAQLASVANDSDDLTATSWPDNVVTDRGLSGKISSGKGLIHKNRWTCISTRVVTACITQQDRNSQRLEVIAADVPHDRKVMLAGISSVDLDLTWRVIGIGIGRQDYGKGRRFNTGDFPHPLQRSELTVDH